MKTNRKKLGLVFFALIILVGIVFSYGLFQESPRSKTVAVQKEVIKEMAAETKQEEPTKETAAETKQEKPIKEETAENKLEPTEEPTKSKEESIEEDKPESIKEEVEKSAEATKKEAEQPANPPKETASSAKTTNTKPESASPATKIIDPVTKYVNVSSLNVRSGAGTNHAVVTTVKQGQAVTVTELSDSWNKVKVNDKSGWVSSKYLTDTKPKPVVEKAAETPKQTAPATNQPPATAPATKPAQPGNVADGLKTVNGNRQLILVTANGSSTRNAKIQTFEKDANGKWQPVLNISGFIGKNGFSTNKKEGDGKSPVGKYTIGTAFGQHGNPGTKLPFRNITNDDIWVDDPESALYNTWQSRSKTEGQWKSAENMTHRLYTYGFVINYNTDRTPYKGSAIFFHTGSSYTLGCVATSQSNVISILKWLDPAKSPVIIMTPTQNLGNY